MARRHQQKTAGLVFSSEFGQMCPGCNQPTAKCACPNKPSPPKGDGIVRLRRETKGRKGRGVTLITGLPLDDAGLKKLAKALKQKCGCGGCVKDGVIEIQGDQRDLLESELTGQGYKVKRAGG